MNSAWLAFWMTDCISVGLSVHKCLHSSSTNLNDVTTDVTTMLNCTWVFLSATLCAMLPSVCVWPADACLSCYQEALQELQELKNIVPKESLVYFLMAKVSFISALVTFKDLYYIKQVISFYWHIFVCCVPIKTYYLLT